MQLCPHSQGKEEMTFKGELTSKYTIETHTWKLFELPKNLYFCRSSPEVYKAVSEDPARTVI